VDALTQMVENPYLKTVSTVQPTQHMRSTLSTTGMPVNGDPACRASLTELYAHSCCCCGQGRLAAVSPLPRRLKLSACHSTLAARLARSPPPSDRATCSMPPTRPVFKPGAEGLVLGLRNRVKAGCT
jgi:hypothetical protein